MHGECLEAQVRWALSQPAVPVTAAGQLRCPCCSSYIADADLSEHLPQDLVDQLSTRLAESFDWVQKARSPHHQQCLHCAEFVPWKEGDRDWLFRCPKCAGLSCPFCHLPIDGSPHDCGLTFSLLPPRDKERLVEELLTRAASHHCPACSMPYVRIDGCNAIRCGACEQASCYVCGEVLRGEHQHKQCGQFTRDELIEQQRVTGALRRALQRCGGAAGAELLDIAFRHEPRARKWLRRGPTAANVAGGLLLALALILLPILATWMVVAGK